MPKKPEVEEKFVEISELESGITLTAGHDVILHVGRRGTGSGHGTGTGGGGTGTAGATHFVSLMVKNEHGNPKEGAEVRIYHGGSVVATGRSDASGNLRVEGLPAAQSYEIEVVGHHAEKLDGPTSGGAQGGGTQGTGTGHGSG